MNKIYGKLLLCLSLFLGTVSGWAQGSTFDIKLTTPTELTVFYQNEYSNIRTFDLDLNFEYDVDASSTGVQAEYTLTLPESESITKSMTVQTTENHVKVSGTMSVLKSGNYDLTCKLSWTTKDGQPETAESKKTIKTRIYPNPKIGTDKYKKVVFSGSSQSLKVNVDGGYSQGWKHEWNVGGTGTSITYTAFHDTPGKNDTEKDVILTSTNYGPDGTTVWSHVDTHFPIRVWATPNQSLKQDKNVDVVGNQPLKLGVETSGGDPSAWTYVWTLDKESLGSTADVSKVLTKPGSYTYKLTLKNAPEGIDIADIYTVAFTGTVYYWDNVQVTDLCKDKLVLLSGSTQTIGISTTGGNTEGWTYTWSNGQGQVPSFSYQATNEDSKPISSDIILTAVNKTVLGKELAHINRTYNITVWPKPIYEGTETKESVTCSGRQNVLSVNIIGGIPSEWKYVWKKNGSPLNCNTSTYSYTENEADKTVNNYTVHVTYDHEGQNQIDKNLSFQITVWPEPVISKIPANDVNGYYGDTKTFEIDFNGGYQPDGTEEGSGWTYEWYIGSQKQEAGKTLTYTVPTASVNGQLYDLKVVLMNSYKGTVWKKQERKINVYSWSKGRVSAALCDSIDKALDKTSVRHNTEFKLDTELDGGYDNGWTFNWKHNGTELPSQKKSYLVTKCADEISDFREDEYTLHYTNKIENTVGCTGDITYNLRIWAEARFPETGIQGPSKVRKDQNYVLSIGEATGGYALKASKDWQYIWSNTTRGTQSTFNEKFTTLPTNSFEKGISQVAHYVNVVNYGPSGNRWDRQHYDYVVDVYNQPLTPVQLMLKGNGTSRTFICLSSLTDQQLAAYDYQFVFGYTSGNEDYEFEAPDHQRYVTLSSTGLSRIDWVYAKWVYEDGTVVTSGKRYLSGDIDADFNGSSFVSGNRAPTDETGVEDVLTNSDQLQFVGNSFVANLSEPTPACLSIYNVSGRLLDRITFDSQSSYNESFQNYLMNPGIYMVEVIVGHQRIVKKVCVR